MYSVWHHGDKIFESDNKVEVEEKIKHWLNNGADWCEYDILINDTSWTTFSYESHTVFTDVKIKEGWWTNV